MPQFQQIHPDEMAAVDSSFYVHAAQARTDPTVNPTYGETETHASFIDAMRL
jgi:hypothetical protein